MDHNRVFAVGDVHGVPWALDAAITEGCSLDATLVLVGDYIDRGPASMQVVELLCEAKEQLGPQLVLLRGNHEVSLLNFLDGGDPSEFFQHGGLNTMRSYLGDAAADPVRRFRSGFPMRHRRLLESTEIYFETEQILISHAGVNPEKPSSRTIEDMTLGSFWELFDSTLNTGKDLVVSGHYVQDQGKPYISEHFICLDTGCGTRPGAPLTAILLDDLTTRRYEGIPPG